MLGKQKRALKGRSAGDFSTDFEFGERDGLYSEDWLMADVMAQLKKRVSGILPSQRRAVDHDSHVE